MHIVADNAAAYAAANPSIDLLAIYPPDGSQRGSQCQCARCRKQSMSDWYLELMNRVAARQSATAARS